MPLTNLWPNLSVKRRPLTFNLRPQKVRHLLLLSLLLNLCQSAQAADKPDRAAILEATRPVAAKLAGQAVRLRVDRLNQDNGWAILVGELVGQPGSAINWERAEGCYPELDKMLLVVLRKVGQAWRVKHIEICASEPPYWYPEQYGGLVWPCGVYAGLESGEGSTLEQQCRAERRILHKSH